MFSVEIVATWRDVGGFVAVAHSAIAGSPADTAGKAKYELTLGVPSVGVGVPTVWA
ncbi:hypothetical protein ACFQ1S_21220 [Kibdelosporangium lantanae]|uniref:Antibiotic biosynthesis monooxygenase n=1 Tax=Kibdelosporangium lantanae TaxID=1497396 RepID=A0ABW3ME24_9PSEU